jgi:hypothetical protein
MTHDYVRNGTTSLFAANDVTGGSVIARYVPCGANGYQGGARGV